MIATPRVSILIATYNRAALLPFAVRSVLSQSFRDFELIILDDASTDESLKAIEDLLTDPRVVYVKHDRNLGINANRNSGLARAKGEYIAMLDSDDVWIDDSKLEKQVALLDGDRRCGLVGTFARIIDVEGRTVGELRPQEDPEAIRRHMLLRNQFIQSSVLIRKRFLDRVGWYDATIPVWEDYELWLRMGLSCTLRNIPSMMTGYRTHATNISKFAAEKSFVSYWVLYRRYRKQYPYGYLLWLKTWLVTLRYYAKHPFAGKPDPAPVQRTIPSVPR
jgi:glycosyltransferase involved in cell wall biosynthesis